MQIRAQVRLLIRECPKNQLSDLLAPRTIADRYRSRLGWSGGRLDRRKIDRIRRLAISRNTLLFLLLDSSSSNCPWAGESAHLVRCNLYIGFYECLRELNNRHFETGTVIMFGSRVFTAHLRQMRATFWCVYIYIIYRYNRVSHLLAVIDRHVDAYVKYVRFVSRRYLNLKMYTFPVVTWLHWYVVHRERRISNTDLFSFQQMFRLYRENKV